MILAIVFITAASLLTVKCEDLDPKLTTVAELFQSMFNERDIQAKQDRETITELLNLVKTLLNNITNTLDSLDKVKREVTELKDQNTELSNLVMTLLNNVTYTLDSLHTIEEEVLDIKEQDTELERDLAAAAQRIDTLQTEVDSSVKLTSSGRIPAHVLPGSYATYTLEDVQWQSLHMAAAAACRGVAPSNGPHHNRVLAAPDGVTCTSVCGATSWKHCDAKVTLMGLQGQKLQNNAFVGLYYDYGCDHVQYNGQSEQGYSNAKILSPSYYIGYCCCRW